MKKLVLICLLAQLSVYASAQTAKPTKEQTVQFIKDYYEGKLLGYVLREGSTTTKYFDSDVKVEFDAKTGLMHINWVYTFTYLNSADTQDNSDDVNAHNATIDLSKVELIKIANTKNGNYNRFALVFNAAPASKFTDVITSYLKMYNNNEKRNVKSNTGQTKELFIPGGEDEQTTNKLWQAFNYLRKLCGAPDPIKFD